MGYWVKFFKDGTQECGTDEAISKKSASWRMGRLSEIEAVSLGEIRREVTLTAPENTEIEWHQFDRYEVVVSNGTQEASRMFRVIQAKITEDLVGKSFKVVIKPRDKAPIYTMGCNVPLWDTHNFDITSDKVDFWLTIVLPKKGVPYFVFTDKGCTK